MTGAANAGVNVRILGRDYQVACQPQDEDALLESATLLDRTMREIRDSGSIIGMDRIAVMAALNLAHEFLRTDASHRYVTDDVTKRLQRIHNKIDAALADNQPAS